MIGSSISHYRILGQLGAGGMGEVYRARDDRLERDVALKILPASACGDQVARARLLAEARSASALNHPGICTIYEVGEEGERLFIAMELIEGGTLADRILSGPLPLDLALHLGTEIAAALAHAHERGVVHRDLKTANIVLTADGRAKVLDFGLARRVRGAEHGTTGLGLTEAGAIVGTPNYLAPEILRGERGDALSDIWALGIVLHEIASGERPFRGGTEFEVSAAILNGTPAPLPRAASRALGAIVGRCLEKEPGRRYPSARSLADELRAAARRVAPAQASRMGAGGSSHPIESIAVLPLENLSRDPEQEFFADGMTDALIMDLAQIGALRVISRTSAMQYKGAKRPLPEIARELNVDAIVEGSVLRSGDRVRITAQLIDAASDRHLWAQRYERSVDDVLGLQSEVARAIAEEIRVKITPHEQGRLARARPIDPEALDAYLRGRYHWNRRTGPELKRSIEHFNRAIELEPGYALAHAGLADAYNILGDLNVIPPQDAAATARAAAKRALELDPSLAEAHTSTGFALFFYDWDWAGAEASYRRALGFNANYATARQWFSAVLNSQGRFEESMAEVMRARELDPLAFIIRTSVADTFYFSRRYDEAIRQLRATIELEPNFAPAHSDLARACAQAGLHDEAIALFERATALSGGNPAESPALAHAYAIAGRHPEARRILERVLAATKTRYVSAFAIAAVYTGLGEPDRAIEWLEGAYRSHDRAMVWLKVHPRLDSLRGDPRFVDLLRRMKFTDGP